MDDSKYAWTHSPCRSTAVQEEETEIRYRLLYDETFGSVGGKEHTITLERLHQERKESDEAIMRSL
jgi:hypothetical protein